MLKLSVRVIDPEDNPVAGVEIWRLHEPVLQPAEPHRAERLGITSADGVMRIPVCYMGSVEFRNWDPNAEPVRVALMVTREGHSMKRVVLTPPVAAVLASGNLLGIAPGTNFSYSDFKFDPRWRERGFLLSTTVTLVPAVAN